MLSLNSQGISSKTGMVGMAGVFISEKTGLESALCENHIGHFVEMCSLSDSLVGSRWFFGQIPGFFSFANPTDKELSQP